MKLSSGDFSEGEMIPAKFTCQGDDINPGLKIEGVPEGAKSLALIFDDPDAQQVVGYTWIHWLVKDIPIDVNEIKEDSIPGTEVVNSFRRESYGGPCPPSGVHKYFFKLYALNVETLDAGNSDDFYKKVEEHKIEEAVLMGKYTKS